MGKAYKELVSNFTRGKSNNRYVIVSSFVVAVAALIGSGVYALPSAPPPNIVASLPSVGSSYTYTNPEGGRLTVTATAISPSSGQSEICDGGSRKRPNFTYHLADTGLILGATDSQLTYDLVLGWRTCKDDIRNYAIYSSTYCNLAGHYGAGANGFAYDCVKYAANTPDNVVNPALGCATGGNALPSKGGGPPTFYPCVRQPTFDNIRKNGPAPYAPPKSLVTQTLQDLNLPKDGGTIGGLGQDTKSNGQRNFNASICQYWKYDDSSGITSDTNESDDDCKPISFNISWTYTPPPSYTLSATVSGVDQNFAYTHNLPDPWYWGMHVDAAANLQPEGIGNHNVDFWRIIYPTAPSDGWSAGVITNGENGLCSALSGYSNCDRIGAYPCVNAIYGCNTLNGAGQFWRWAFDEQASYPIGTRVCYISRVSKPTYTSGIDDWKGSVRVCSVSGVKPKVQAWGYDTKATGLIKTSLTNVDGDLYGSWGEYGVLSNLRNQNMASGNGLLGGRSTADTQGDWSPLTFANDSATAFSCPGFGCYGGVAMPNVSVQGAVDAPGGGDYTLNNYDQVRALVGSSKGKFRVNGTLTIASNIEYPATVDGISNIPKIQLIADDIVIDAGVTRIDPWLIAYRPATNTYGRISTCNQVGVPGDRFEPMATAGLYSGICNTPLKFNSPLIADKVYLYRTYDQQDGAIAAETLNVRADNYLSSYVGGGTAQPVATTDAVVELPPRF